MSNMHNVQQHDLREHMKLAAGLPPVWPECTFKSIPPSTHSPSPHDAYVHRYLTLHSLDHLRTTPRIMHQLQLDQDAKATMNAILERLEAVLIRQKAADSRTERTLERVLRNADKITATMLEMCGRGR